MASLARLSSCCGSRVAGFVPGGKSADVFVLQKLHLGRRPLILFCERNLSNSGSLAQLRAT